MTGRFGSISAATAIAGTALLFAGLALAEEPAAPPLPWVHGPATAEIGPNLAEIQLSESYVFLDGDGTKRLMELTQNPVSGNELATVSPVAENENWFVVFEYDPIGYVKDDEKDALDADAMLASIRKGTEASNDERRERGWATMEIVGWHEPPHYDARTKNLSWAIIGSSSGHKTINRTIKLLGRRGVMTATLVASPDELVAAIPLVDQLIDGYRFKPGSTYAEFVPSTDKLAEYGLTALVVGGAGAALVKSGLLAKLWKPIAVGIAALGAGVKRLLFSGRKVHDSVEGSVG